MKTIKLTPDEREKMRVEISYVKKARRDCVFFGIFVGIAILTCIIGIMYNSSVLIFLIAIIAVKMNFDWLIESHKLYTVKKQIFIKHCAILL